MITLHLRTLAAASTVAVGVGVSPIAEAATAPSSGFNGYPAVGALFSNTTGSGIHSCTASVVNSTSHDTLITAAHCIAGSGANESFVPGYVNGRHPYGTWRVIHAYVDPHWKSSQNPLDDVAVLTVAKKKLNGRWQGIQDVTHGGYSLSSAPGAGTRIQVPAYNAGMLDRPIRCGTSAYRVGAYPAFNCSNYNGGVSGAPFLQTRGGINYVTGVIGGLHQGGCSPSTSFSSPFGSVEQTLLRRAQTHSAADIVPTSGDDGC